MPEEARTARLFTYRRCPYAMRARMALLVADIAFKAFEISLRDKPADMLAASPKGTVPVLLLPDGRVLEQSLEIMEWALAGIPGSSGQPWWAPAQTREGQAWIAQNDGPFKHHLDRYKYPERFPDAGPATDHRDAAAALLQRLDTTLIAQPGVAGAQPSAVDLALFPFVRQFAAVDRAWFDRQPWPALHRWLAGWLDSPLFARCMAKLPDRAWTPFPT